MEGTQKSVRYQFFVSFFVVLLSLLMGLLVGSFASVAVGSLLCIAKGEGVDVFEMASNPIAYPEYRTILLIMQGVYSLVAFWVTPYFVTKTIDRFYPPKFRFPSNNSVLMLGLTLVIMFAYFPLSSYFVTLNQGVAFPEALQWLEEEFKAKEVLLQEMTTFLTQFDSFFQFLLGLVIIAVIPAIGEEYVFRGLLQSRLTWLTQNTHLAIWVSAFVFSIFHQQFYGVLPRMALGGIFGYLYLWSGSLWIPILAHFFNNGFTLAMVYFYENDTVELNIEEVSGVSWQAGLFSLVIVSLLLYIFRQKFYNTAGNALTPQKRKNR